MSDEMTTGGLQRRTLCSLALAALLPATTAAAGELPPQAVRAVRAVVEAQLAALAEGDAERAFSYASPAIRSQFGTAEAFMAMVLGGYPMVVRPARVAFLLPLQADGVVLQPVQLRDRSGALWRATYALQQQPAGWRIEGCTVVADSDRGAT